MTSILNDNVIDEEPDEITGSEAVCRSLIAEGVDTIFGYPGGAIMPVYDALHDHHHHLKHVLTRHEQGAVHAAQGYARVSGKVGVCIATSGPGATNLITGIADALIDSTPLVCITGQVVSGLLGTDAFQESDVIGITSYTMSLYDVCLAARNLRAAFPAAHFCQATVDSPGAGGAGVTDFAGRFTAVDDDRRNGPHAVSWRRRQRDHRSASGESGE